jgi:hypothetical protein
VTLVATDTIFGRIVTGADVEDWVFAVLQKWSCTYMAEIERQHGLTAGTLPAVRAWVPAQDYNKWPEDQVPGVMVISTGTAERPTKDGQGHYRARYAINVAVLVSAATQPQTHRLADLYLEAHKLALVQHQSLEGHADGVDWVFTDLGKIPYDDLRSLGGGEARFVVDVTDVATVDAGPATPDEPQVPCTDPWPLWPTVKTVDIDIEWQPITLTPAPGGIRLGGQAATTFT